MKQFRLVNAGWGEEIEEAVSLKAHPIRVICPFIKFRTAQRLLKSGGAAGMRVLTRFEMRAFNDGASDIEALRLLLTAGASIRGVRGLHSKLYLFGSERVIVTSANLTEAAMRKNHEFGFVTENPLIISECSGYFEALWPAAAPNLTLEQLDNWESLLLPLRKSSSPAAKPSLPDFGVEVHLLSPFTSAQIQDEEAAQAFLKFFGTGDNRSDPSEAITDILESSGCHWACTYPPNKRPRQVADGDAMFMGRISNTRDVLIFGRAIARRHRPGIDEATADEIAQSGRGWKASWPIYVRVHGGRFINGHLGDGVSLRQMMEELGADTFLSTQRNSLRGEGNVHPRRAMMQKAHMQLTPQAERWLSERLEAALKRHGEVDLSDGRYDSPALEEVEPR